MKKDFTPKYKYFTNNKDTVVAVCRYVGRPVKGIAKCAPEDVFDFEKGKLLAKARCDLKVVGMREKNARLKEIISRFKMEDAIDLYNKYNTYLDEATRERVEMEENYRDVLKSL